MHTSVRGVYGCYFLCDLETTAVDAATPRILDRFIKTIFTFNVFADGSDDVDAVSHQRMTTRVYLLVFFVCLYIVSMRTIFLTRTEMDFIGNLSENDSNHLLVSRHQSLECPCQKIAIEYRDFLTMTTKLHQVCSSDFVRSPWRDLLFGSTLWDSYHRRDIRVRGSMYFSLLSTLCSISNETVNEAIEQFLNETFISAQLMLNTDFHRHINNIIFELQKNTQAEFYQRLQFAKDTLSANAFVSAYDLNWYWQRGTNENIDRVFAHPVLASDGCSCATRSDCLDQAGVYLNHSVKDIFPMTGWNIACSVLETLLHSTLECLYNETCIQLLRYQGNIFLNGLTSPPNISFLNRYEFSRFRSNTTIQNILHELFLEEWKGNISYSSFYQQCAPTSCSYQTTRKDYLLYTSSKLLGLYGGLTVVLRFLVPLLVRIVFQTRHLCRVNTVAPARSQAAVDAVLSR